MCVERTMRETLAPAKKVWAAAGGGGERRVTLVMNKVEPWLRRVKSSCGLGRVHWPFVHPSLPTVPYNTVLYRTGPCCTSHSYGAARLIMYCAVLLYSIMRGCCVCRRRHRLHSGPGPSVECVCLSAYPAQVVESTASWGQPYNIGASSHAQRYPGTKPPTPTHSTHHRPCNCVEVVEQPALRPVSADIVLAWLGTVRAGRQAPLQRKSVQYPGSRGSTNRYVQSIQHCTQQVPPICGGYTGTR